MRAIATATPSGIIVSGPTAESVNQAILQLYDSIGTGYASFTMPAKDAGGEYVSIGHVHIFAPGEKIL